MKKTKEKNSKATEPQSVPSTILANAYKAVEEALPTLDKDLAKYIACSALSGSGQKFISTFSLCYQVQTMRKRQLDITPMTNMEKANEDYLCNTVIGAYLGSNIVYN